MTGSMGISRQPSQLQQVGPVEGEITTAEEAKFEAQVATQASLKGLEDDVPAQLLRGTHKTLDERRKSLRAEKLEKGETPTQAIERKGEEGGDTFQENPHRQAAEQFQKKNPQVKANNLLDLRDKVKPESSKEEILGEIGKLYPKQTDLAVEALNFLIQTTTDPKEKEKLSSILSDYKQTHAAEIAKDKRIGGIALTATTIDPAAVRNMHQSMTHDSPREFKDLFHELHAQFPEAKSLKEICKLLLSAAGEEIKFAPIDERGRISNILKQIRSIQASLGAERYFEKGRSRLEKEMRNLGIEIPPQLNPQTVTLAFIELILTDYPNSARVMQAVNTVFPS